MVIEAPFIRLVNALWLIRPTTSFSQPFSYIAFITFEMLVKVSAAEPLAKLDPFHRLKVVAETPNRVPVLVRILWTPAHSLPCDPLKKRTSVFTVVGALSTVTVRADRSTAVTVQVPFSVASVVSHTSSCAPSEPAQMPAAHSAVVMVHLF